MVLSLSRSVHELPQIRSQRGDDEGSLPSQRIIQIPSLDETFIQECSGFDQTLGCSVAGRTETDVETSLKP